jgi:hypothetical protein
MALTTLKSVLPRWKHQSITIAEQTKNAAYPLPTSSMQFIGEIISRFNVRRNAPAGYYKDKINQIKHEVKNNLLPELQKNDMVKDANRDFCLAEIKDFGGLQQTATDVGVPIIALEDADMGTGVVRNGNINNRNSFISLFNKVSNTLIKYVK